MKKFLKFWFPVVVWMGVIFWLSSIPDLESGLKQDYILRKFAHMIEFAILTYFLYRAIREDGIKNKKAIIFSLIIAFFYALTDEYHQSFVLGRQCSFKDVGIDSVGILISALVCYIRNVKGR